MHSEAYDWVRAHATTEPVAVLDIGGRNINGTVRDLFPAADPYLSIDLYEGNGVDIVADASTWTPDRAYEVVVCCEVFEHTDVWRDLCTTAYKALTAGGLFIVTCAGPGRPPHSAIDGGRVRPEEFYGTIPAADLKEALAEAGFEDINVDWRPRPADTRATATKPGEPSGTASDTTVRPETVTAEVVE